LIAKIVFILFGLIIAYSDFKKGIIPNKIVIPATLIGIFLTGYLFYSLAMFILGASLYKKKFWAGGDVKLCAMMGAFLGVKSFMVLVLSVIVLKIFGKLKKTNIAYAPIGISIGLLFL